MKKSDYYLFILGVDQKYKGQGFASKLLKPMLKRLDEEGKVCSLITTNPVNLDLYRHFGFEVDDTLEVNSKLKIFQMIR